MGPYYDQQVGRFGHPDPWPDREILIARARRARAEAAAELFGAIWASLKVAAKAVAGFAHHAGTALTAPRGDARHHTGPARLTGGCD